MRGPSLENKVPTFARNIRRGISLPEGLDEDEIFSPDTIVPLRRTSSTADIARFYRYFQLVRKSNPSPFTWTQYLEILQDYLSDYETPTLPDDPAIPRESEMSVYATPQISFTCAPRRSIPERKTELFSCGDPCKMDSASDAVSSSPSERSSVTFKSRGHLLMKICKETRALAQKIYKTVELIARLPDECTECGMSLKTLERKGRPCGCFIEEVGDAAFYRKQHTSSKIHLTNFNLPGKVREDQISVSSLITVSSSKAAGKSASRSREERLPKKRSLKRLVHLCSRYVTRG